MIKSLIRRNLQPAQLIVLSFLLVILVGMLLLMLPQATRSGQRLSAVDALFTATSATCVTGLVVVDTGTIFSTFGQIVILACIQIGGLGLMTLTTVLLVLLGHRLAIADRISIQESFHHTPTSQIGVLVKYIIIATFITEFIGALLLTLYWSFTARFQTFGETIYHAVFHSVSAFCNAGFALYADSIMGFRNDPVVLLILSSLIIVGGIGFLVGLDIKEYVQQALFHRLWPKRVRQRIESIRPRPRLSTHTKFVITTTVALLLIGTLSFYLLERANTFAEMTTGNAWMNAFFCSVTPRTAGFNSIDYTQMSGASLLCTMVLMFIGASPGSTGGGIKASTFGLLIWYSISRWRGFRRLHAFNRTVPQESIDRAGAIVIAAIALVILASSALMTVETYGLSPSESQNKFLSIAFETISAFGTVGLSLNYTALLSVPGKLIIAFVMFMGRIGPLTLALAISHKQITADYRYAEENVMIG
ncbi:MAG: hypothetical protein ICV68_16560 [Pyrinomonadaceae bacterium]|nr:hypothetical protein [Pyrinomonadaceae bacterium]